MDRADVPRPKRRFNLGDGLILMAVVAWTLAMLRGSGWFDCVPVWFQFWCETLPKMVRTSWPYVGWGPLQRSEVAAFLAALLQLLSTVLVGLTLVQPVMRLRWPRPPRRELVRQSGLAACLAVILGTLVLVDLSWVAHLDVLLPVILVPVLLLLWPVLGLPPWRSEKSWIDRLGRGVGWGWIVLATIAAILPNL
jgi:hypothetical protein